MARRGIFPRRVKHPFQHGQEGETFLVTLKQNPSYPGHGCGFQAGDSHSTHIPVHVWVSPAPPIALNTRSMPIGACSRVSHLIPTPNAPGSPLPMACHGYLGRGGMGTGMGRLKVTHQKPTPRAQVWRVFPGIQSPVAPPHSTSTTILHHHHTTTDATTQPAHKNTSPEHDDAEVERGGGDEKCQTQARFSGGSRLIRNIKCLYYIVIYSRI